MEGSWIYKHWQILDCLFRSTHLLRAETTTNVSNRIRLRKLLSLCLAASISRRHESEVCAVRGQVVSVEAITALRVTAHITALRVVVEPAAGGQASCIARSANAYKQ